MSLLNVPTSSLETLYAHTVLISGVEKWNDNKYYCAEIAGLLWSVHVRNIIIIIIYTLLGNNHYTKTIVVCPLRKVSGNDLTSRHKRLYPWPLSVRS